MATTTQFEKDGNQTADTEKYIFQVQQTVYSDHEEIPTKWMSSWADIEEFDDREKALEEHERSGNNSRVVAVIETDGEREGKVDE